LQYILFLLIIGALVKPVGSYLALVFAGENTFLDFLLRPLERWIYRLARVDPHEEMDWQEYASSFVCLSLAGTLTLFFILRLQSYLPLFALNANFLTTPLTPDLAMNTAISFATTTTWQAYGGESTMSYFSQIVGLTVQNFLAGRQGWQSASPLSRPRACAHQCTGQWWIWYAACSGCCCRCRCWAAWCWRAACLQISAPTQTRCPSKAVAR
jgi:K+-transporting ATPase ATPase A chain